MDTLITNARDFDRKNHTISLGVCAPAPVWTLAPLITNMYHHMALQTETKPEDHLFTGLLNNTYQLIATHIKDTGTPSSICITGQVDPDRESGSPRLINAR